MMDGRETGRCETDAGLQYLWWFHVHRGLCMGGALGHLALMPEGSECPLAVSCSGALSALDTLCFSAEQILTLPPRSANPDWLPPTLGAHSSRPFVGTRWPGSAWVEEPGLPSQLT